MKNFEKKINANVQETTSKPARKSNKARVAAIILTAAVAVGALTVIGVFGRKASQINSIPADRLATVTNTVEMKKEPVNISDKGRSYQYFAPAQTGNSQTWKLVKGGDMVEVSADYDAQKHLYKFDIKGKEKGTAEVELSYQVKENKINTAKMTLSVDDNLNVSKITA